MKDMTLLKKSTMLLAECSIRMAGSIASGLVLVMVLARPAAAQFTGELTHYYNQYDVKNYAIDKHIGSGHNAMAGTIFNPSGDNSINFMITGNTGPSVTLVNREFNDVGYDERAVGTHFVNNNLNDIVIVASRGDLSGGINTIELIRTEPSGNLQSTEFIHDRSGYNMYPLGTLMVGKELYICGYVTPPGSPVIPENGTDKEIFVLMYDLEYHKVKRSIRYNYGGSSGQGYDYDKAVRMKLLTDGNIFVTGSCNADNHNIPNYDPMSEGYYCGTLALVLDQDLVLRVDAPFSAFRPVSGGWPGPFISTPAEYGFDISEDPAGNGYFIFGNSYWVQGYTSVPLLQFIDVTFVDRSMNIPVTRQNRIRWLDFDHAWGVNLVEGNFASSVILSGYQSKRDASNSNLPTTLANINPFLTELKMEYTNSIAVNPISFSTILSVMGTGDPTVYANNFRDMGDYFSNLAWGPPNTVRDLTVSQDIHLSAPIWNPGAFNKLNIKTIRTDDNGEVATCPIDSKTIITSGSPVNTWQASKGNFTLIDFAEKKDYNGVQQNNFVPDNIISCQGSGVFRPTGIQAGRQTAADIVIAPNPAHDYITIVPETDMDTLQPVLVSLSDIAGRHIAILYKGNASDLNSRRIRLPALSGGLYLLSVKSGNGTIITRKLEIR